MINSLWKGTILTVVISLGGGLVRSQTVVQEVVWTDVVGSTSVGTELVKTAPDAWGNSAGASLYYLESNRDGWVEYTVDAINRKAFGLSDVNSNNYYSAIDYCFNLGADSKAYVLNNGTTQLAVTGIVVGDVLRIERIGSTISFKKNGVELASIGGALTTPLIVDVSLFTMGSSFTGMRSSFGPASSAALTWLKAKGIAMSGDNLFRPVPFSSSGSGYKDSGAVLNGVLNSGEDGWIEMGAEEMIYSRMIGLSFRDTIVGSSMEFALQFSKDDNINVYEDGVSKIYLGHYTPGTIGKISREGSQVKYYIDGVLRYTSLKSATGSLRGQVAFYNQLATMKGVYASFGQGQGLIPDRDEFEALKSVYDSLGGTGWHTKTNWPAVGSWPRHAYNTDYKNWYGVTVTNGDVTGITLAGDSLMGKIPYAIRKLRELKVLSLPLNSIGGRLDPVSGLSKLEQLTLNNNQLTGSVPVELCGIPSLKYLILSNNQMTGSIPAEIGQLSGLGQLHLNNNGLSGNIPATLNNLTLLTILSLASNQLTGDLPMLGGLENLSFLDVSGNSTLNAGVIPEWISSLTNLTQLNISNTNRSGSIPTTLGNLIKLRFLYLSGNALTGELPSSIGDLLQLKHLYIINTQLTGPLPTTMGNLSQLEYFYADGNQFTGSIPSSFANLTNLILFYVSGSKLSGEVPSFIGNWTKLQLMNLNSNLFTGAFPSTIGNCSSLTYLRADFNKFSSIPDALLSLPVVSSINFDNNELHSIPLFNNQVNKGNLQLQVSNNFLDFSSLEPLVNAGIKNLVQAPQKRLNDIVGMKIKPGSELQIPARSGGGNSSISWERSQRGSGTWTSINAINLDSSQKTFRLGAAQPEDGSLYRYRVTNTVVTGFSIESVPIVITVGEDVAWNDMVQVNESSGSLMRSVGGGWGDAGGNSENTLAINTDGWIELVADAQSLSASVAIGFSQLTGDYSLAGIAYGIELNSENGLKVFAHESAVSGVDLGSFTEGDVFRIARSGSTIHYYKNNVEIRSVSSGTASQEYFIKALVHSGKTPVVYSSFWIPSVRGAIPDAWEFAMLKDVYDSLGGPSWTNKTNWPAPNGWVTQITAAQMDSWYGIGTENGDITSIIVYQNNLIGKLPASLSRLGQLKILDMRINKIGGSIPVGITTLSNLRELRLYDNLLTGEIPASIGNLTNLEVLTVAKNNLTGQVPAGLGNLTKLYWLGLYRNVGLSGTLPSSFYNLVNLTDLYIFDTQIEGTLAPEIGNLSKLKNFWGYRNKWSGTLPATLGNISTLENLYLYSNNFTGGIPDNWQHLTGLKNLWLHFNQLTGTLPATLGNISTLENLYLHSNNFTGGIPDNWQHLTGLKNLWLHFNQLTGDVPAWLGGLTQMEVLSIGDNKLSGKIPVSLRHLTNLTGLYMQRINLSGTIPDELQALNKLTVIDLKFTNLEGAIPSWLMNMPTLKQFYFNDSKFSSLADFSGRTDKSSLIVDIKNNQIPSTDIERYFTAADVHPFTTFSYGPQRSPGIDTVRYVPENSVFRIEAPNGGTHAVYRWEKENAGIWMDISSQNESTDSRIYEINNATASISGTYRFIVTNSWMSAIAYGDTIDVKVGEPVNDAPIEPLYNGLITAMHWRTSKARGASEDLTGMYRYSYDERYQIIDASWLDDVNRTLGTYGVATNKYRMTGIGYDPNGNILSLKRFDATGNRTNNFRYHYSYQDTIPPQLPLNNQLKSVDGYVGKYTYNKIGQMISEEDKIEAGKDQYVEYDVTGRVVAVYSSPDKTEQNKKVEYQYDDRGFRLAKIVYGQGVFRTTWYIRDASGNVLSVYEQDGLPVAANADKLVQTEVPVYGSGKLGTYYPQQEGSTNYEITDHLGNVRALLRDNINVYTATMEDNEQLDITNPAVTETGYFQNIMETVTADIRMNHTAATPGIVDTPDKSAYLYWIDGMMGMEAKEKAVGPAMMLKVEGGDKVDLETWVRYENKISYSRNVTMLVLSQFLGGSFAYSGGFEGYTLSETSSALQSALGGGGFMGDGADETRPFAYLNYILFDQNMTVLGSSFQRVPAEAGFDPGEEALQDQHTRITVPRVNVTRSGYLYIWVSNESENTKVWFDDLKVTHTQTLVTQATDYGVWGDVLREQKSDESVYRHGYQGQFSEKDLETGWNHFELREYDPVIGRWTTKDPAGQYYSPYVAMGNNPISNTDPDGGTAESPIYSKDGKKFLGVDSEGFTGQIITMDEALFNNLTSNGQNILDHNFVTSLADNGIFANYLSKSGMSLEGYANVYTHVLKQMEDMDFSTLFNGSVSIYDNTSRGGVPQGFNSPDFVGRYKANPEKMKININSNTVDELSSVEIIQNYLGVHEWKAHNIMKYNNGWDHYKAYDLQRKHPTFNKLPTILQNEINERNTPSFR